MYNKGLYGSRIYGAGKYGADPVSGQLWGLEIDWDNDGIYTGENEAVRMTACSITRGRRWILNSSGDGFEPVAVGTLSVELDNDDGRFDTFNAASPIYPYVRPGVNIRLRTRAGSTGTIYPVFTGRVSDVQPISGSSPRKVRISATDGVQWLRDASVTIGVNQSIAVDDAVSAVLDAADWPWARSLEPFTDVLFYWWVNNTAAQTAIQQLVDVSQSTFFIAADGTAKLYSKNHYIAPAISLDQVDLNKEISIRQPWEVVKNSVTVIGYPRTQQSVSTLWQLSGTQYVGPGETFEIWGPYSYGGNNVPALNVIAPVATTDYTANTAADGSGTNLTSSFVVTADIYSETVKLSVINNSASGGYITLLKVRGDAISKGSAVQSVQEDATSKGLYGTRSFKIDSPWLQNSNGVIDLATALLGKLSDPQRFPVVQMDSKPGAQFALDLFDTVALNAIALGISGVYQVGQIQHEWTSQNGQDVHTIFTLEPGPSEPGSYWTFPTQIGLTSIFGS